MRIPVFHPNDHVFVVTWVIIPLVNKPLPNMIDGVGLTSSVNFDVMVTVCEPERRLSASVSVNTTVGGVLSTIKVMLFVPV